MSVKVNIPSHWQVFTRDKAVVEVKGKTVGQCLDELVKQFPSMKKVLFDKDGNLNGDLRIFVNKEDSYPEGLNRAVMNGDELFIPELIAGG